MEKDKKVKLARTGIATKGIVYCLAGILSLLSALGAGGKKTGIKGVLDFVQNQTFGQILLGIIAAGLLGYVFWRFYQAFSDPEDKGSDAKGIGRRIGYFASGLSYSYLIYVCVNTLTGSGSSGGSSKESLASTLLQSGVGQIILIIIGIILFGKAIYQFYRAYSGKFKKKVKESQLGYKARQLVLKSGKIGYTARGVVIAIIAYFITYAAISTDPSKIKGTKGALQFIETQSEWGTILLVLVSVGLVGYGIFMIIKARYREMAAV